MLQVSHILILLILCPCYHCYDHNIIAIVFFSDIVGFTGIAGALDPNGVISFLNEVMVVMDYVCSQFPLLYKVETIGDAYMVCGGVNTKEGKTPESAERILDNARSVCDFAVCVQEAVKQIKSPVDGSPIRLRIGEHC
jgi:guanylate cyclase soluble subunit beta